MTKVLITKNGNILVKQGEKEGYFTPEKTFLRYAFNGEWQYAIENWNLTINQTRESFMFPPQKTKDDEEIG